MGITDELQKLVQLRTSGTLTDAEFAQAKAVLLSNPQASASTDESTFLTEQLLVLRRQNELAQIDREWEIERRQFQMLGRYGRTFTPTIGMGIATAIVGGIFGIFWTVFAFTITNASDKFSIEPDGFAIVRTIFPILGVLVTCLSIGRGIYCCVLAHGYNEAYRAYQAKRLKASHNQ